MGNLNEALDIIATKLEIYTNFVTDIGLYNGKMGIAIFFYHLAKFTKNSGYRNFADALIDNVLDQLDTVDTYDFENGLIGIGWGIEYLVQNKFIEADTDIILHEIDDYTYTKFLSTPYLINEKEINGVGLYYLIRLKRKEDFDDLMSIRKKIKLIYCLDSCERLLSGKEYFNQRLPQLSVEQLNSVVFFLLEIKKLKIFPTKVRRLINLLPTNTYLGEDVYNPDRYVLEKLTTNFFDEEWNLNSCKLFSIDLLYEEHERVYTEEIQMTEFVKCAINKLLYGVDFQKANCCCEFIDNTINLLVKSNNKDCIDWGLKSAGLSRGLAGVGLSMLFLEDVTNNY